jgi:hypothetical protein
MPSGKGAKALHQCFRGGIPPEREAFRGIPPRDTGAGD